jgi:hypothetical protein
MAVTIESESVESGTPAEVSAHEAAVAEGASDVHAALAEESAAEAREAAEIALSAAQANIESGQAVAEATESAQAAAGEATISAKMVMEALDAQSAAISALAEQFAAERKSQNAPPPGEGKRAPSDRQPGGKGPRWVRR